MAAARRAPVAADAPTAGRVIVKEGQAVASRGTAVRPRQGLTMGLRLFAPQLLGSRPCRCSGPDPGIPGNRSQRMSSEDWTRSMCLAIDVAATC